VSPETTGAPGSPTRLSVALVVHGEQAYLRECLDSILAQAPADLELVIVDDATPDHGRAILECAAAEDERVVLDRLDPPVSQGEARNAALDAASGTHVWFVEPLGLVPPGAVSEVTQALADRRPDVLLIGREEVSALGKVRKGPHATLLGELPAGTFTADDRPEVLDTAVGLTDKVFGRDLVAELGARFRPGRFGELAVTVPALLSARRISALDRVCYRRRDVPNPAEDPLVHGSPLDAVPTWDAELELAGEYHRGRLAAVALRHRLAVLRGLEEHEQEVFFGLAAESARRHSAVLDTTSLSRRQRLEAALLRRGDFRAYRTLEWGIARRRTSSAKVRALHPRAIVRGQRRRRRLAPYRAALSRPLDPHLAVFAAYWYRGYSCNPRALYEKLGELAPHVRGVWVVRESYVDRMPAGVQCVVAGTPEYWDALGRASYLVNNVNFPNEIVKREGTIHVQTHHGTPVKRMGLDLRGAAAAKMNFAALLERCARWDYSVTANTYSTLVWERVLPGRYETLEVGSPRNDTLFDASSERIKRIRTALGLSPDRRVLLYLPTHREYRDDAHVPLDVAACAERLGPDTTILTRLHYFDDSDEVAEVFRTGRVLDVSRHPSVEELYLAADVLVTDYSSAMFDYAVLDRPIVIHAPDWEEYRAARGVYFDLLAEPPGVVARTEDDVVQALASEVERDETAELRGSFRERFCSLDDGHAAERVVRRVWASEIESEPEPRAEAAALEEVGT